MSSIAQWRLFPESLGIRVLLMAGTLGLVLANAIVWFSLTDPLFCASIAQGPGCKLAFDSAGWRAPDHLDNTRYRMWDDFLKRYRPVGMGEDDLRGLLGPPEGRETFPTGRSDVTYHMGPQPGLFRIDSIWITFEVRAGIVSGYRIWED